MKTVLILGAGKDQLPAIKKAKQIGYKVISCDLKKNAQGKKFSDLFWNISNTNIEKLKDEIIKYNKINSKIDGVLVIGADIPNIASKLSHLLNFRFYKNFAAKNAKDKILMKKLFKKYNILTPNFIEIKKIKDLINFIKKNKKDTLIKPIDRSGARGVYLIEKNSKYTYIKKYFKKTKSVTSKSKIIAEEFLTGIQISTESIIYNNRIKTIAFADRNYEHLTTFKPRIIENGGTMPSKLSLNEKNKIDKVLLKVAQALKISNGTIKGDIVIHKKRIYVIEVAYRLSGGDFSESLIPLNTGIDFIGMALRQCVGDKIILKDIKILNKEYVMNRYFFLKPGILKKISGIQNIKKKKYLKKIDLNYKIGQKISPIESHKDRGGVFVVTAKNLKLANRRVEEVYSKIKFVIRS